MAKLPTPEETAAAMIEVWKDMNIRAGESAPVTAAQVKLGSNYRADDINAALAHMQEAGLIESGRPGFVKLTQAGYGPEPSSDEIKRAVLDAIGEFSIRPGEVVPSQPIWMALMKQGYNGQEFATAIDSLAADGMIEMRNGTAFLTNAGFEAI